MTLEFALLCRSFLRRFCEPDLRQIWGEQFPKLNAIRGGESFHRGKAQLDFPPGLDGLVILVGHPGDFREAFLSQSARLAQGAETFQERREGSAFQHRSSSQPAASADTLSSVVLEYFA